MYNIIIILVRIYILLGEPDSAIAMYKKYNHYEGMLKLVKAHHPDLLSDTYAHLAKVNYCLFYINYDKICVNLHYCNVFLAGT